MLIEAYIEALLVDEDLANQVWELWNAEIITDGLAEIAAVLAYIAYLLEKGFAA